MLLNENNILCGLYHIMLICFHPNQIVKKIGLFIYLLNLETSR